MLAGRRNGGIAAKWRNWEGNFWKWCCSAYCTQHTLTYLKEQKQAMTSMGSCVCVFVWKEVNSKLVGGRRESLGTQKYSHFSSLIPNRNTTNTVDYKVQTHSHLETCQLQYCIMQSCSYVVSRYCMAFLAKATGEFQRGGSSVCLEDHGEHGGVSVFTLRPNIYLWLSREFVQVNVFWRPG